MQRFRNILLMHDPRREGSSDLWAAAALARRHDAPLTVVEVIPKMPYEADVTVAGVDLSRALLKERRRQLEYQLEPLREDGLDVRTEIRCGRPGDVLAEKAHELGRDLLVVDNTERADIPAVLRRQARRLERRDAKPTPVAA